LSIATTVSAQTRTLRIVCYNIEADVGVTTPLPGLIAPPSDTTDVGSGGVLEGIGEENVGNDRAQPLDILGLEETTSNSGTIAPIVTGLNTFYNAPGMYAMSTYQATESGGDPTDGNGPNALVYNTTTVQLLASVPVDPPGGTSQLGSSSGEYREVMRYEFAPAGVTPTAANEFYVYVSHYKAETSSSDMTDRNEEAQIIRNNEATNLPATARVLYVGDYNVDYSSEAMYQTLFATNAPDGIAQGQGIDPLNQTNSPNIDWEVNTSNTNILFMLTEEDYELRYRDDLQMLTTNVYFGAPGGLVFVPGTYHAFANNATTSWGSSVNNGSDTALLHDLATDGPVFISASQLYLDLTNASDHLPVVADYTIPIPAPAPVANFTASPTNGLAPLTVSFSNLSTNATNYLWNFGDGNTSASTNATDTYTNPGVYSVTLTAVGAGGTNILTLTNYITAFSPPPVAAFTASPTSGVVLLPVNFSNASTGATNYLWNFGDGNTSTGVNPVDVYTNAGTYSVTLTAVGPGGTNTLTLTNYIVTVNPPPLQLANFVLSANGFQFTASNSDGSLITSNQESQIQIFATTNLALPFANWTPLTTSAIQLTNGFLQIIDTNSVSNPQMFYNAIETP
jgi:PKD repeat protein